MREAAAALLTLPGRLGGPLRLMAPMPAALPGPLVVVLCMPQLKPGDAAGGALLVDGAPMSKENRSLLLLVLGPAADVGAGAADGSPNERPLKASRPLLEEAACPPPEGEGVGEGDGCAADSSKSMRLGCAAGAEPAPPFPDLDLPPVALLVTLLRRLR